MALFADYVPTPSVRPPPAHAALRPATRDDLPALAALRAERDGMPLEEATATFEGQLARAASDRAQVLAAVLDGVTVAYSVAELLAREGLPPGWYLGGVVVAPAWRRRGIGVALTRERLRWIARRATRAYYFTNERNRASIDLHAAFGFREILRDLKAPGLSFTNGIGLLFAVELSASPA